MPRELAEQLQSDRLLIMEHKIDFIVRAIHQIFEHDDNVIKMRRALRESLEEAQRSAAEIAAIKAETQ